ncbi:MAG TPA: YraN family protein [Thermoanaerobaculia bacterium]|nr:YraN family protein [Thermoanaerobaculia bacterium]
MNKDELGRRGERRALWFYLLRGYRIVAKNVRFDIGEIDLVVRRRRLLVFVEVKSRQQTRAGAPHEAVTAEKRKTMVRLAERFAIKHRLDDFDIRFDVLSLFWTGSRFQVEHFGDAFRPVADEGSPWKWK